MKLHYLSGTLDVLLFEFCRVSVETASAYETRLSRFFWRTWFSLYVAIGASAFVTMARSRANSSNMCGIWLVSCLMLSTLDRIVVVSSLVALEKDLSTLTVSKYLGFGLAARRMAYTEISCTARLSDPRWASNDMRNPATSFFPKATHLIVPVRPWRLPRAFSMVKSTLLQFAIMDRI